VNNVIGPHTFFLDRRAQLLTLAARHAHREFVESGGLMSYGSRGLVVYPDADLRLAISRAVAIEAPRGWRIGKDKQTHKIDIVIALAMAAHAAVQGQNEYTYDLWSGCVDWDDADEPINLPLGYTRETMRPRWPGARAYTPTGERQRDRTACPRAL
jgi:hypothetical protein